MTGLQITWTIIFIISIVLFLGVEIVVVIGGAGNVIDMMRSLLQSAADKDST